MMKSSLTALLLLASSLTFAADRCQEDVTWTQGTGHGSFGGGQSYCVKTNETPALRDVESFGSICQAKTNTKTFMWVGGEMSNTCVRANSLKEYAQKQPQQVVKVCQADADYLKKMNQKNGFYCETGWAMLHLKHVGQINYASGKCQLQATDKVQYAGTEEVQLSWTPGALTSSCKVTQE